MVEIKVKKSLFVWAIKQSGKTQAELSAESPALQSWLKGKTSPTMEELSKFTKDCCVPFGYMLIDKPPNYKTKLVCRRSDNKKMPISHELTHIATWLEGRQAWFDELAIKSCNTDCKTLAKFLKIEAGWCKTQQEPFDSIRKLAENIGVYVFIGNADPRCSERKLNVDEFHGLVLTGRHPVLFINSDQNKNRLLFSLVYGLAAICHDRQGAYYLGALDPPMNTIDNKIHEMASEFLIPADELRQQWAKLIKYAELEKHFNTEPTILFRRLYDLGLRPATDFLDSDSRDNAFAPKIPTDQERLGGFGKMVHTHVTSGDLLYTEGMELCGLNMESFTNLY